MHISKNKALLVIQALLECLYLLTRGEGFDKVARLLGQVRENLLCQHHEKSEENRQKAFEKIEKALVHCFPQHAVHAMDWVSG